MTILAWTMFVGVMLILASVMSGWIRRGPVTSFALYLVAGVVIGPGVLGLSHIALQETHASVLRGVTELGLVVSLFITGLKLRISFRDTGWRMAGRLALPAMVLTIAIVTMMIMYGLGWPLAPSLALAAILSPTDPVLASLISVDDARDDDALRVALSGEAGLNDGTALPFLLLALALSSGHGTNAGFWVHWLAVGMVWNLFGGLAIGFLVGWSIGRLGTHARHVTRDVAPSDFLALGIMATSYVVAEWLAASGFLAAFAAGVGLRRVELGLIKKTPAEHLPGTIDDHAPREPAELLVNPNARSRSEVKHPAQSVGWVVSDALSFGETAERLIGAGLVLVVGIATVPILSLRGVMVAAGLMLVARPVAIWMATWRSPAPWRRRLLIGWFGIRGLGSLNYLAYALGHGLPSAYASAVTGAVLTTVALSVISHGITVTPLMTWRRKAMERLEQQEARLQR